MRYLILGASASGINCAKTIRKLDPRAEITMVSKDKSIYSRCMLHYIIGDTRTVSQLNFTEEKFLKNYQVNWIKNTEVIKLNSPSNQVLLDNNSIIEYDRLLIATGSSSFIPAVKNFSQAKGIYGLRDIEDAIKIKEKAKQAKSALVLGAGLVGIDAVIGLLEHELKISIVEMSDRILPMQLDKKFALPYEKLFRKKGVQLYTGLKAESAILDQEQRITGIRLSDDQIIDCDMVVVATGVKPNIDFIREDTINLKQGIIINERCETNINNIFAAGDVTGKSPIWPLAVKQGIVAAHNMVGVNKIMEDSLSSRNSMNFLGLQTISLGIIEPVDNSYHISIQEYQGNSKKIIHKNGVIQGAILQGDTSYCGVLTHLIKNKVNISGIGKDIFDIDYSDFYSIKDNGEYSYSLSI